MDLKITKETCKELEYNSPSKSITAFKIETDSINGSPAQEFYLIVQVPMQLPQEGTVSNSKDRYRTEKKKEEKSLVINIPGDFFF